MLRGKKILAQFREKIGLEKFPLIVARVDEHCPLGQGCAELLGEGTLSSSFAGKAVGFRKKEQPTGEH